MPPTTIALIRHAEKPAKSPPPYGVTIEGERSKKSLSPRGWQRAGALVPYFRTPWARGIATPGTIYAAGVGKQVLSEADDAHDRSVRPQETAAPLAAALGLAVVTDYAVGQEAALVAALRARDGDVLVVWEHEHIPEIATRLGAGAPDAWPDDAFDVVWLFRRAGAGYAFEQLRQDLLAG